MQNPIKKKQLTKKCNAIWKIKSLKFSQTSQEIKINKKKHINGHNFSLQSFMFTLIFVEKSSGIVG
jgi:hypothetical protein